MKKKFSSKKYKSVNIFNKNIRNDVSNIHLKMGKLTRTLSISKNNLYEKEEIFCYDKSQKEILLLLIKNSQLNIINQLNTINSAQKMKKKKNDTIKDFLIDLKGFLAYLLNEKIKNKDNLQLDVNNEKANLQKRISDNMKYDNILIKNNSIIKKNFNIKSYIDTEMVEKNFVGSEISKLKLQNFKTENEILKTEFAIFNIRRIITLIKNTCLFPEENREIYFYNNINQEKINEEFNHLKQINNNILEKSIIQSQEKKEEIEQYIKAINKTRNDIQLREHIYAQDTIQELSIEDRVTSNS